MASIFWYEKYFIFGHITRCNDKVWAEGMSIVKEIVVPNKLVNLAVKPA